MVSTANLHLCTKVKAHMETVTQYPRPLVQLFRKTDGRRWPSAQFPAHLLMGQVFRNGDDLAVRRCRV